MSRIPVVVTIKIWHTKHVLLQDIENALKHEELSLETLIIMKNDNHATLCETTSLKTILLISYDDESKEKKEEYSCVEGEDDKNFEETSTEKTEETTQTPVEAQTEKTDYSDSCKTKAKNELNRNIVCDEETDKIICNLQCPEGTKAESNMSNPYICSFNTGTFTPDIPKCIKGTLQKLKLFGVIVFNLRRLTHCFRTGFNQQRKAVDKFTNCGLEIKTCLRSCNM